MSLSLFVEHHFTARLLHHVLLGSLHQAEGAAPTLSDAVDLRGDLAVVHQRRQAQEAGHDLKEHLGGDKSAVDWPGTVT